jgi:hypothetical protein
MRHEVALSSVVLSLLGRGEEEKRGRGAKEFSLLLPLLPLLLFFIMVGK